MNIIGIFCGFVTGIAVSLVIFLFVLFKSKKLAEWYSQLEPANVTVLSENFKLKGKIVELATKVKVLERENDKLIAEITELKGVAK